MNHFRQNIYPFTNTPMEEDSSDESECDNPQQNDPLEIDEIELARDHDQDHLIQTNRPPQCSTSTPPPPPPWSNTPIATSLQCPALEALEKAVVADINTRVMYHLEQLLRAIAHDEKMSYQRLATRYLSPLKESNESPPQTAFKRPRFIMKSR